MQNVVDPGRGLLCERRVGEITFEKFDAGNVVEIAALSGDQAVGHADRVPAPHQFFGKVRTDETGAAGDEVMWPCAST